MVKYSEIISSAMHTKMVENIGDVLVIIDNQGINRYKSPNIEKHFGWKPEDVIGESTWNLIHPDDLHTAQEFIASLLQEAGTVGSIECRYRCKDGNYKWIEFIGKNLLNDPEINGILGNYRDISERKEVEKQIQDSETRYKSLFHNLSSSFSLYEVITNETTQLNDYRFLAVNPAYEQSTNVSASDLIGKTLLETFPATEEIWIKTFGEVHTTGIPAHLENYSKELNKYFELIVYCPQKGQIALIGSDITQRKLNELEILEAKKRVEESEEKYRLLAENSNDVVWLLDLDLNFKYISPSVEKLYGYSVDERIKFPFSQLYSPETIGIIKKQFAINQEIYYKTGVNNSQIFEFEGTHKNGQIINIEVSAKLITDKMVRLQEYRVVRETLEKEKKQNRQYANSRKLLKAQKPA
ncbi:MAG: PAS domain S-box protein [Bacteroidetes bacterium]|nr:PAS domain S-box protein [Bacteroidales bacterium]NJO69683.1 PAS domain S-box protein [Bacteroidota bacterium]